MASLARGPLSGQRGKICGVVECWEWKTDLFVCLGDEGEGATADATSFENFGNYFRAFWRSYFDWSDKHAFYWLDWDAFDWADSTRFFPGGLRNSAAMLMKFTGRGETTLPRANERKFRNGKKGFRKGRKG